MPPGLRAEQSQSRLSDFVSFFSGGGGGGGGVLLGILGGGVPPISPNPDTIQTKKCNFPHPFVDQTT